MTTYLFVGEKRSQRAIDLGLTWIDGGLAAAQLFQALIWAGIDPQKQQYINLWKDNGRIDKKSINKIRVSRDQGLVVVGLGQIVQQELAEREIDHIPVIHPAARGKIRAKTRYARHLRQQLISPLQR